MHWLWAMVIAIINLWKAGCRQCMIHMATSSVDRCVINKNGRGYNDNSILWNHHGRKHTVKDGIRTRHEKIELNNADRGIEDDGTEYVVGYVWFDNEAQEMSVCFGSDILRISCAYELQPNFRLIESSIRDIFIFLEIELGLGKRFLHSSIDDTVTFAYIQSQNLKTTIHSSKIDADDLELYTKYWPWPIWYASRHYGNVLISLQISPNVVHLVFQSSHRHLTSAWPQFPRAESRALPRFLLRIFQHLIFGGAPTSAPLHAQLFSFAKRSFSHTDCRYEDHIEDSVPSVCRFQWNTADWLHRLRTWIHHLFFPRLHISKE